MARIDYKKAYDMVPQSWIIDCHLVGFAVPADHKVKMIESEKIDKYLDVAWELEMLRDIKVSRMPIVVGPL